MLHRRTAVWVWGAVAALTLAPGAAWADDELDELQEKAIKAALKKVGPSVVKIETSGGTEVVRAGPRGMLRLGAGPTTGLVVSDKGYVITSAFNFANNPTTIRVQLQGVKERKVARVVATDETRMLTLLKVMDLPAGTKLAVPKAVPKDDMVVGYTALAVGRTLGLDAEAAPSVSQGILSATDRIWGRALQTDAKVSPTNYGGPLIDLYGRVYGVLVPASPQGADQTAGFEWYDSGIGFAIPLDDIYAALPRLLKGTEKNPVKLRKGFLGISMSAADQFGAAPVIAAVETGSAADKAGLKANDTIQEIDGKVVRNYAQVQHRLGGKYEGDKLTIKVLRDKEEVTVKDVVLGSSVAAYGQPFLGILPLRDDPDPGVEVRYVYPKGPADVAGIKAGDRIMKIGLAGAGPRPGPRPPRPGPTPMIPITRGRDQLMAMIEAAPATAEVSVEVRRKGGKKTDTVKVKLGELPEAVPDEKELPDPDKASAKKALTKPGAKPVPPKKGAKEPELGRQKRTTPSKDNTYHIYVPEPNYDANVAHGLVVWLHPAGKNKERDFEDFFDTWEPLADKYNLILVCPQSDNPRGWTPGESDFVQQAVRAVMAEYTVDPRRVVAHGMAVGGEMAFYLGFQARALIRGVAPVAAHLGSNPREKVTTQPLSFYLVVGTKDPLQKEVEKTRDKLKENKYPVMYRPVKDMGHQYIDGKAHEKAMEELLRWLDSLDRI